MSEQASVQPSASGPLAGLRILSIEQYGAGPFGTQHLADLGAEVIKVENFRDGGDVSRLVGPHLIGKGDSLFFQSFNRNKRSIGLDLKHPDSRPILHRLVAGVDAVFNNLRGDLPQRMGLDYASLSAVRKDVACVHLSAYGRSGSRAGWPGYDYLMQAEAGYLGLSGEPDGPPARMGLSMIDLMTGTTAAMALLAGVLEARRTGIGRDHDVCLFDVAMHNLAYVATWSLEAADHTTRLARSAHPSLVPSQLYRTADGWIFLMCNKEKFWANLCNAIARPDLIADPRFKSFAERRANRDALTEVLDAELMRKTTADWGLHFAGKVPAAPVHDLPSALASDFVAERGLIADYAHPERGSVRSVVSPIQAAGHVRALQGAPRLGQDTDSTLLAAGYSAEQVAQLRALGAVS